MEFPNFLSTTLKVRYCSSTERQFFGSQLLRLLTSKQPQMITGYWVQILRSKPVPFETAVQNRFTLECRQRTSDGRIRQQGDCRLQSTNRNPGFVWRRVARPKSENFSARGIKRRKIGWCGSFARRCVRASESGALPNHPTARAAEIWLAGIRAHARKRSRDMSANAKPNIKRTCRRIRQNCANLGLRNSGDVC
jgi:hypothetical protein